MRSSSPEQISPRRSCVKRHPSLGLPPERLSTSSRPDLETIPITSPVGWIDRLKGFRLGIDPFPVDIILDLFRFLSFLQLEMNF
jgi:hypothetical protein